MEVMYDACYPEADWIESSATSTSISNKPCAHQRGCMGGSGYRHKLDLSEQHEYVEADMNSAIEVTATTTALEVLR
jgi:hypothetical protein